jgi:hypothetical protein
MLSQQIGSLDPGEIDTILNTHLERRAHPRFPYRVAQKMAPIRRGIQGPFRDVNCSDLSAGGISFYMDYPPDFDTFAIILDNGNAPIRMLGKVVGHEQMNGQSLFLVRCQFMRRLEIDQPTPC